MAERGWTYEEHPGQRTQVLADVRSAGAGRVQVLEPSVVKKPPNWGRTGHGCLLIQEW